MGEGVAIDGDDPAHIKWIHEKALARAEEYGIQGVTYRLTQGISTCSPYPLETSKNESLVSFRFVSFRFVLSTLPCKHQLGKVILVSKSVPFRQIPGPRPP